MTTIFDQLNVLSDADLRRAQGIATLAIEDASKPLVDDESFEDFMRRPRRLMKAQELLVTAAMLGVCRRIENEPMPENPTQAALFRRNVERAVLDYQRESESRMPPRSRRRR